MCEAYCLRHAPQRRRSTLAPLVLGQRVMAKWSNGQYYAGAIVEDCSQLLCDVRFTDGSIARDLSVEYLLLAAPADGGEFSVRHSDTLRDCSPGDSIGVEWDDGQTYVGRLIAYAPSLKYRVDFDDGYKGVIRRSDCRLQTEPCPRGGDAQP